MDALPCHRRCCSAAPTSLLITNDECRHVRCVGAGAGEVGAPPRLAMLTRWRGRRERMWAARSAVRGRWRPERFATLQATWGACATCVGRPRRPALPPGGRLAGADRACMAPATSLGLEMNGSGTSKGPEEAAGVLWAASPWPTAMPGTHGAPVARLTRCHIRQSADLHWVWPLFG